MRKTLVQFITLMLIAAGWPAQTNEHARVSPDEIRRIVDKEHDSLDAL